VSGAARATADEVLAGVELRGTLVVVTGASGGLGAETARSLAAAGADLVLGMRDPARGAAALAAAQAAARPGARVTAAPLDLASLASVRAFADALLDEHERVDVLINNAGVMSPTLTRTAEGFEPDIGVNHLGHYVLTLRLAGALAAGAPARVVNVGSRAHRSSDIVWEDPHFRARPYDKWIAYGQSKTANSLFTVELDRRLAPRGVRAYVVFPGMIGTGLFRHLEEDDWAMLRARVPSGRIEALPVEVGAATIVWAATASELDGVGGVYVEDCAISGEMRAPDDPRGYMPYSMDGEAARRLWEWSERETGERLPPERS